MQKRTAYNLVRALLGAVALCMSGKAATGQATVVPFKFEKPLAASYGLQDQKLAYLDKDGKPTQPGKPFYEVLRGNGTRAGYVLSHGGIIPGSVSLTVGARSLRPAVDYFLDYANGALFFTESVRRFDSISVRYSYVEGQDGQRNPMGAPALALNFRGTSLNFGMGISSSNGLDFTTYGLAMNSTLGKGSTLNGLMYYSTPAGSNRNMVGDTRSSMQGVGKKANADAVKSDRLIVQNLNVKSGSASFRATYQDVGQQFNGFQAMRQQNARNADVMAQINALERERGIQRLGFGAGLGISKNGGLSFDWDKIGDGKGDIVRQSFGYQSKSLNFRYGTQEVGEKFELFKNLREGEAGQWARERGIKRTDMSLGFTTGKDGAFGFNQNSIGDRNGRLSSQGFSFDSKIFNFAMSNRKADAKFARLNDLSDADKTSLALEIRRQYDPNAKAEQVTARDKELIPLEQGLTRDRMAFQTTLGKQGAFAFNNYSLGDQTGGIKGQSFSLNTKAFNFSMSGRKVDEGFGRVAGLSETDRMNLALDIRRQFNPNAQIGEVTQKERDQMGAEAGLSRDRMAFNAAIGKGGGLDYNQFSIKDSEGGIERRTLNLTGKNFAFNYLDQNIGQGFSRLRRMSEFERSQFGNEIGIRRTGMGLNLALNRSSSFAFTQLSLRDQEGGMSRQGFAYDGKGMNLRLNLADTDKSFARARDLAGMSDAEKQSIETERGFKRMDFSANVTSIKNLTLNTYVYDANNAVDRQSKDAFRHFLAWQGKASKISYLTEGNSFGQDGRTQNGVTHDLLTYDTLLGKGMKFNAYRDTVATIAGGNVNPTVATNFLHFETDRSLANNLMAETKRIDFGNGKFENTTQFDLNYRTSKAMSLRFNRLEVDRGSDPSAVTNLVQWNWQVNKGLNFSGLYAKTDTNNKTDATVKGFTLTGMLTKDLNVAGSYNEINQKGQNVKAVSDISFSNARPMNLLGLKDTTFTFKYASVADQHKEQKENVSGSIQGMLGKNKVAFEYGGTLDEKGNNQQARTVTFISDRNEKLPFHFDLCYKAVNINRGDLKLERRINLDWRMSKVTSLTYTYSSLPFNMVNNQSQPVSSSVFALNHTLSKAFKLNVNYTTAYNEAQKTRNNKLAAIVSGRINQVSNVEVGYDVTLSNLNGQNTDAHTLRLAYNLNVNADQFFALSTAYTMNMGVQADDVQANVDFKSRF